jgi:hypothetical protein
MMLYRAGLELFFWLMVAHALADFPLQGDFVARAKNHRQPLPGVPWPIVLASHAIIHAGFVAYITGSAVLGMAEYAAHAIIDFSKSEGWLGQGELGFAIDQGLHVLCKVVWVAVLLSGALA